MSVSRSANRRFRRFRKGALSSFCRHGEVEEIATRGQAAVRSGDHLVTFCRRAASVGIRGSSPEDKGRVS
jgi:hypothetical protein